MRSVLVIADGHYYKTFSGKIYAENTYTYSFFKRYLTAFDAVYVLARVSYVARDTGRLQRADGKSVFFIEIPDYYGASQQLKVLAVIYRTTLEAIHKVDCILLRVPSATANSVWWICKMSKKPTALEVVVDPYKYFGKETADGFLTTLIQKAWTKQLKKMCMAANGVSYVTHDYLQGKYPCKAMTTTSKKYFTSYYSSVNITSQDYGTPRKFTSKDSKLVLLHVCNYINGYRKGHVTVIKVLRRLRQKGVDATVRFVGEGFMVDKLKKIAVDEGVAEFVTWVGRLHNHEELKEEYKTADLLMLPSMGEGLPRVLIEGMAMGIPCLASPVCGIPELLPADMLYKYDDVDGYVNRIVFLKENPRIMDEISKRNLEKSKDYSEIKLNGRREQFYRRLRELTE